MTTLTEPYYSEAHQVFRAATNQAELMLDRTVGHIVGRGTVTILSVGSGAGLFEIPMLARLRDAGVTVSSFVGVDPSPRACSVLRRKLDETPLADHHDVVTMGFEAYTTTTRYDVVLFNHVFEYLLDDPSFLLRKSASLRNRAGHVVIFSPTRGGINAVYEKLVTSARGSAPLFADDIEDALTRAGLGFSVETMIATCDISSLKRPGHAPDKLKLLSFLAQEDCRAIADYRRDEYINYYLSLREPEGTTIAHPVALLIV